ncbi:MAG TPA: acylphosphatase [Gemmataceae bacterium]|jgi:acylphosphatase|nr:acylphosphatase [Gemmataceae bacterium]
MTAKHILYAGRVQGVGFRQTTAEIAERFTVAGYVRNLPSGEVELLVQGDAAEVERFLTAIDRRMEGYIQSRTVTDTAAGDHDGFEIRV